jgi:hypothetical protein
MKTKKSKKRKDPLEGLIKAANPDILGKLIIELASERPEIRRECFDFLKAHVTLASDEFSVSEAEALFALWLELEPDLSELDEYGGGDYNLADHVYDLLYELSKRLQENKIPRKYRQELLDEVLPYIHSGNAGLDDALYDVAYATCYDEEDLRGLAERFEEIGRDWPLDHARRIYRKVGDHKKYLELRSHRMSYGADYHDLATFYWEIGKKDKGIEIAEKGLKEAEGRMNELRSFMMERTLESDDRSGYLDLQFGQATDRLTLKDYKEFRKICSNKEWKDYEQRMLEVLERASDAERLKIHMLRKEYDQALTILTKTRYPDTRYGENEILKIATKLEKKYPEAILSFYMSGLGNLNYSFNRKTYAQKAAAMKKVRHMYVNVMNSPDIWQKFARKVKNMNLKRPAFQEEFSKALPGWKAL